MSFKNSYIVAARRSALGRVGGLHKRRRLHELAAPVIAAVLADARIDSSRVDEIILGNASEGGNPARLVALAAGLSETAEAISLDRQCGSGLDAVAVAVRAVALGDSEVVVAGGAESLSTAPWRIARPRNPFQLPQFIRVGPDVGDGTGEPERYDASDRLARKLGIGRSEQDDFAWASYEKAAMARDAGRFIGEIVPMRVNAEEARDESAIEAEREDIVAEPPFNPPEGTATAGNTSGLRDGAAFVVVVSQRVWEELGRPPALRLAAWAATGVDAGSEAEAPVAAMHKLMSRANGLAKEALGAVEMSEASAAQALALTRALELDQAILNADGGAIARGHPLGAAGALLAVRLFTRMVRNPDPARPRLGVATLGTYGGMGLAALFEAVDGA